ncbi:hypothetical protein ES705_46689 [subsurface metagenome]
MREIIICEHSLVSVDEIDDVIEICTRETSGGNVLLKITQEAWEKICEGVIDEMERGASPEEEVE